MNHRGSDYNEYPKTLPPDDFWGQARRTINGKPVSEEQIQLIVDAIKAGLQFEKHDLLLDFACGNGALTRYFFDDISYVLGVDASEYLINIANRYFQVANKSEFIVDDAAHYPSNETAPLRFNKVLCYGAFSFFSDDDARQFLRTVNQRFTEVERIYIGNLPDKEKAEKFYPAGKDFRADLSDHTAPIGIWRSKAEMDDLAKATGWRAEFRTMPEIFYASHYRFDVLLYRGT